MHCKQRNKVLNVLKLSSLRLFTILNDILISIFDTFEGTGSNALLIRHKVVQHQSVKMIFIAAWSTKIDFIPLMLLNRVTW